MRTGRYVYHHFIAASFSQPPVFSNISENKASNNSFFLSFFSDCEPSSLLPSFTPLSSQEGKDEDPLIMMQISSNARNMIVIGREDIVEISMRDNRCVRSSAFILLLSASSFFWEALDSGDKSRIVSTSSWIQYHARVYVSPGTSVDVMVALRTSVE